MAIAVFVSSTTGPAKDVYNRRQLTQSFHRLEFRICEAPRNIWTILMLFYPGPNCKATSSDFIHTPSHLDDINEYGAFPFHHIYKSRKSQK